MGSSSQQAVLPGTETVIATYVCGHGRTHQVPSETVAILKAGGAGFIGYCTCGGHDLDDAADRPHILGDHSIILGGTGLEPALWLALEDVASGEWTDLDGGDSFGSPTYRERREEYRQECEQSLEESESA